eukprot:TRINITY_DN13601_c0_g1_i1.p1 TRINITY_DN13601_c0_g1~~TRINITY_DN13601_c0_g1_i1.p1  ORF type:complete len:157 (+),score=49.53 TRINITY_DN13601_c0_g1_i1:60-473(+)
MCIRDRYMGMDGREFAKMTKDTHLIDRKLTTTDVDLTFAKVKDKSARKINFEQFKAALQEFATKKGVDIGTIEAAICSSGGPHFAGTKADYVKFHDDKNTYTGVYAQGGPDTGSSGKIADLSNLCDRAPADNRGVKK